MAIPIIAAAIGAGATMLSARSARKSAQKQADATDRAAQLQYDAAIAAGASQVEAAQIAARAQIQAGKIAAEAARFRPYSITTGFGSSSFDTKKDTGTYTLDPRLAAFRDQYYSGAQDVLNQQQSYDPLEMARQVYGEQQGLLQPGREAEDVALRQAMLSRGRVGLGVSGGAAGAGADGMLNPDQFSMDRARALADAELAAKSRDYGETYLDNLIRRGQGLLTYGTGLESLGMGSLTMGLEAGAKSAQSQAKQAEALLQSGMGAAETTLGGTTAQNNLLLSGTETLAKGNLTSASQRIAADLARNKAYTDILKQGASLWGNSSSTPAGGTPGYNPSSYYDPYAQFLYPTDT
jgi:hypothetical protein